MGDRSFSEVLQAQERCVGSLANFADSFPARGGYRIRDPGRKSDILEASTRGIHQGQRSCKTALKGRTHDCKRPLFITRKNSCKSGAIHT